MREEGGVKLALWCCVLARAFFFFLVALCVDGRRREGRPPWTFHGLDRSCEML
jgi:hypothetical protein